MSAPASAPVNGHGHDEHELETPGMFESAGRLLAVLAVAGMTVALLALGIWKLAELIHAA